MKKLVYVPGVVTLELDETTCNGCGMCLKVCPHAVFILSNKKAHIVKKDNCMECGACEMNCAVNAVKVKAGVGCAAGLINAILLNSESDCCC